jgi:hypothetical protein
LTGAGTLAAELTVTPAVTDLLLDLYPNAAAAYSLRKLRTAYTGDAIRVRRSSDNTEQDIGFVSGNLDETALTTFCGVGNGFVTTWYDQSGNARNATNATAANQPQIVSTGVVVLLNSKSALLGNGNYFLTVPSSTSMFNFLHNGNIAYIFSVQKSNSISVENKFFGNNSSNSSNIGFSLRQNSQLITNQISRGVFGSNSVLNNTGNILTTNQILLTVQVDADNAIAVERSSIFLNNGNAIKNNANLQTPSLNDATNNFQLFNDGSSPRLNGNLQEIIIYDADQSGNRTLIRDNINTYYAIY